MTRSSPSRIFAAALFAYGWLLLAYDTVLEILFPEAPHGAL